MSYRYAAAFREAAARTRRDIGIKVIELGGFATRGHYEISRPPYPMWHDTVTRTNVSETRLGTLLRDGYTGLPGPIANVGVDRPGTLILVAAGGAFHAGSGGPWHEVASNAGNRSFCGIEVANAGFGSNERWTGPQYDTCVAFSAHLADILGNRRVRVCGHGAPMARRPPSEWTPRKIDPWSIAMNSARADVVNYRARQARDYITTGDNGPQVFEWQGLLVELYGAQVLPQFGADSDFGNETRLATLKFFDEYNLEAADRSAPRVGAASVAAIRQALKLDPLEAFMANQLTAAQRTVLTTISNLSEAEAAHVVSFAKAVQTRESSGRGVANAAIDDHRQRQQSQFGAEDYSILSEFIRGMEAMGTTPRTLGAVLVAVVREARAQGWIVSRDAFALNAHYRFSADGVLEYSTDGDTWNPVMVDDEPVHLPGQPTLDLDGSPDIGTNEP